MTHLPADILNSLNQVTWSAPMRTSHLLAKIGYENGFCGVSDRTYVARNPHHVRQVHGTRVASVAQNTAFNREERPEADGIYSTDHDAVAVKTADCLPVLIGSSSGSLAMAVHAGWRGLTAGILINAISRAESLAPKSSLRFAIGPSISMAAFEVGPEVIDALRQDSCRLSELTWPFAVTKGIGDRWHVDLQVAAALQLISAGIDAPNIEVIRTCTSNQSLLTLHDHSDKAARHWHSYRREGKGCGSNWAWIKRNFN